MTTKLKPDITFFEALKWASLCIKDQNIDPDEVQFLLLNQMNWQLTNLLANYHTLMTNQARQTFENNVNRLIKGEPAQYIIGKTDFYGYPIQVNSDVLIPRVETEELVEWILSDYPQQSLKILDIGTGSGAIAIALKKQRPDWQVAASDISENALKVAQSNARLNKVEINFVKSDLLAKVPQQSFDVIVSNPPYIASDEKSLMDQAVLGYEPQLALFAPHHGLLIYERLAKEVGSYLTKAGALYLEIGFQQGPQVTDLFANQYPKAKVTLHKDLANHDRMIKMKLKENKLK